MNRAELHQRADDWITAAETLLAAGQWSLAYYLAGYAVEFALKACVLSRMIETGWVFREKVQIKEVVTHDFHELARIAGLEGELRRRATDGAFQDNWDTATGWDVASRYQQKSEAEARSLLTAIRDQDNGVLPWLTTFW